MRSARRNRGGHVGQGDEIGRPLAHVEGDALRVRRAEAERPAQELELLRRPAASSRSGGGARCAGRPAAPAAPPRPRRRRRCRARSPGPTVSAAGSRRAVVCSAAPRSLRAASCELDGAVVARRRSARPCPLSSRPPTRAVNRRHVDRRAVARGRPGQGHRGGSAVFAAAEGQAARQGHAHGCRRTGRRRWRGDRRSWATLRRPVQTPGASTGSRSPAHARGRRGRSG